MPQGDTECQILEHLGLSVNLTDTERCTRMLLSRTSDNEMKEGTVAEILEQWPTITRTRKSIYPWDEWTDGNIRQAKEGEDFSSSLKTFVQGLYAYANRHGAKVEVRTAPADGVVAFRFVPAGEVPSNGDQMDDSDQSVV